MWLSDEQKDLKLCLFLLIRRIFKVESQNHFQNWNEFLSLQAYLILTFKFLLTYSVNYAKYPNEVHQASEYVELINWQACFMIFWAQLEL
jgi:hypothetical protein